MTYAIDPEIEATVAAMAERFAVAVPAERDDWKAEREGSRPLLAYLDTLVPPSPHVTYTSVDATADDGTAIEMRWYTKDGSDPGAAVVYAHGGGMILASAEDYSSWVAWYVEMTGIPFLSVDYRLAPEATGTTPARDVFAGLRWLVGHAAELGVDPARIAVMGDSAGAGLAAAVTILARQHGVPLARQILIYPMLDDRLEPLAALEPFASWTYDQNYTGWHALLGDDIGGPDVSPVAAPARLTDHAGLPPAYLEVGDLDIFRDEDIAYAQRLSQAEVSVELHLRPGATHGFDRIAPTSALAQRAMNDRIRVLKML